MKIPISNIPSLKNSLPYLKKVIHSKWISSNGRMVYKFEKKFSKLVNSKYSIAMNSGTAALISAISCLKKKNTKYVALPSLTFGACCNAIKSNGLKPIFIDSENDHWNISISDLKKKYNKYKFDIVLVVHLNGYSANITEIKKFCKKKKIKIIEDCAEALGTKYNKKMLGTFGDIGTYSFFANKLITTGEGGMCVTNNLKLLKKMKISQSHGMNPNKKYWHVQEGFNHRMTSLQAALGISQLEKIKEYINKRKYNNKIYLNYFKKKNYFQYKNFYKFEKPIMWYFPFVLSENYSKKKNKLLKYLYKKKIETREFFYPLDQMKIFSKFPNTINARKFHKLGFYLPVDTTLNKNKIMYVCNTINKFFKK